MTTRASPRLVIALRLSGTGLIFLGAVLGLGPAAGAAFLLYLLIGWFVRPRPDWVALGWGDEDPSQNMVLASWVLAPGFLLAEPVADAVRGALAGRRDY